MESLPIIDPSDQSNLGTQSDPKSPRGSYSFVSLGCPKNLVDSERMLGLLQLDGYQLVPEPEGADFVVVNTCGFIESARQESFQAIDEMLELKRQGKTRGVIVSGCLAERQKEQLLKDRPEIDSLVGVFGREEITKLADRLVGDLDEQRHVFRPAPVRALPDNRRLRITPTHFAYLKVSEGCDRLCTFCAIPGMRGKHATKPMEDVLQEARELGEAGVKELIIVAQDTTYYGIDLYGEPRLNQLLQELDQIDSIEWIRLMYFYPMYITDELLGTIANANKIIPYIDMPLQHASDPMLRRMSRRVNRADTEDLLIKMRERIPELTLRTTMITGFPGETDEDFREMVEFVQRHRFERLGVFTYSIEPGTPAERLPNHLPDELKNRRREELMAVQQTIAFARNEAQIGQQIPIILDAAVPDQEQVYLGRTQGDAPDVDGLVFVTDASGQASIGSIVKAEVVASQGYDLIAVC